MLRRWLSIAQIASLLLQPSFALAATRTWDGGGANTLWSTAANWSDDTAPTAADTALFDGTGKKDSIVDSGFQGAIAGLSMTAAHTGSVLLQRGTLTVNGPLFLSGGTLDMRNSGSTLALNGSWFNGGGTFRAGTGTVVLAGSGAGTHTLRETGTFRNLTVDHALAGYWDLDEGTGLVTRDKSRFRNNGTFTGSPTWIAGQYGNAAQVTGGVYSLVPSAASLNFGASESFTLSIWVKPTVLADSAAFVSKGAHNLSFPGYAIRMTGVAPSFRYNFLIVDTLGNVASYSDPSASTGSWLHLAMVVDRNAQTLTSYINGVAVNSSSTSAVGDLTNASNLRIGRNSASCCTTSSALDDLRLYRRALTANEMSLLYQNKPVIAASSATYALGAPLSVSGSLRVFTGTLDASADSRPITLSGAFINEAGFTPRSGTVTFRGNSNHTLGGGTLANLVIDGSRVTLVSDSTVSSALSVGAGSTLSVPAYILTASSTITNAGTITQTSGGKIVHAGAVSVSPTSLTVGGSVSITVTDSDANTNGSAQDTVTVTADGETITLTETTNDSGIFTGSIPTAHGAQTPNNGVIEHNDSCSFRFTPHYRDPEDTSDDQSATATVSDPNVPCATTASGGGGGGGRGSTADLVRTQPTTSGGASSTPETPAPSRPAPRPSRFRDVPVSSWFASVVSELHDLGIVSGYQRPDGTPTGTFGPADPVTRAQILKMALLAAKKEISTDAPANPSARNTWAAPYVRTAQNLRLSLFTPALDVHHPATRGEVAQILAEMFGVAMEAAPSGFRDVSPSHPHVSAIAALHGAAIVEGDRDAAGNLIGLFRPDATVNRAEAAAMVSRAMGWEAEE